MAFQEVNLMAQKRVNSPQLFNPINKLTINNLWDCLLIGNFGKTYLNEKIIVFTPPFTRSFWHLLDIYKR